MSPTNYSTDTAKLFLELAATPNFNIQTSKGNHHNNNSLTLQGNYRSGAIKDHNQLEGFHPNLLAIQEKSSGGRLSSIKVPQGQTNNARLAKLKVKGEQSHMRNLSQGNNTTANAACANLAPNSDTHLIMFYTASGNTKRKKEIISANYSMVQIANHHNSSLQSNPQLKTKISSLHICNNPLW